ncbi:MAG: NADH-quinone oxidoreductase subunit J family protein [Candidatus Aquicultorales bacterium]
MSLLEQAIFILLGLAGIGSALAVVTGRNLFRSTLFFGVFLLAVASLYFVLEAAFVGIMQVFVYVGGVVVMILFGIMLTQRDGVRTDVPLGRRLVVAAPVVMLVGLMVGATVMSAFRTTEDVTEVAVTTIGRLFVNEYVLPFEMVSIVLLAALIGAIAVAKEREE